MMELLEWDVVLRKHLDHVQVNNKIIRKIFDAPLNECPVEYYMLFSRVFIHIYVLTL